MRSISPKRGFTLLELLFAVTLSAMVATAVLGGLYGLLRSWQSVAQQANLEATAQRFYCMLEADLAAAVAPVGEVARLRCQKEPFVADWLIRLSPNEVRRVVYRQGPPLNSPLHSTPPGAFYLYRSLLGVDDEAEGALLEAPLSQDAALGPLLSCMLTPRFADSRRVSPEPTPAQWAFWPDRCVIDGEVWPLAPTGCTLEFTLLTPQGKAQAFHYELGAW